MSPRIKAASPIGGARNLTFVHVSKIVGKDTEVVTRDQVRAI